MYYTALIDGNGDKKVEEQLKKLTKNNWGLIIFKPPRASGYLKNELEKELFNSLIENKFSYLGSYKVDALTKKHIHVMYPGDSVMPYWSNLENKLLGLPAYYFLFISTNNKDIKDQIKLIKGWYKTDLHRGRTTPRQGLRAVFRSNVELYEGDFQEILVGSKIYEDSGIHAPCSIHSRFLQLLGFMAIDQNGAKWARQCLEWLNN